MRYLTRTDVISALERGRSVEQLLVHRQESELRILRFIRIDREPNEDYSVTLFEVIDEGTPFFLDIYEFPALDPDFPHGEITSFSEASDAVRFSHNVLMADLDKFVNAGVIQDECRDIYQSGIE